MLHLKILTFQNYASNNLELPKSWHINLKVNGQKGSLQHFGSLLFKMDELFGTFENEKMDKQNGGWKKYFLSSMISFPMKWLE